MKIFTDLHHADLYFSLHLLFESRLGHEIYHPIGLDWFHEGYWDIAAPYNHAIDTVRQYLDPNKAIEGFAHEVEDGTYHIKAIAHNYTRKAITLDKFKSMKFDVVMPSYPTHDKIYERLRNQYQPQAKILMQMGNIGQRTHLPNVLHSSQYKNPISGQNCLKYEQEINSELFHYCSPFIDTKNIYSMVNCAPYLNVFNTYKETISEANWKYYGGGCPDGMLMGPHNVSKKMKEANVGWHLKPSGDIDHSIKGWFAIGRPLVANMSRHRKDNKDIFQLFEPDVTYIDLELDTIHGNSKKIRELLDPDTNIKWCERVRKRFDEVINYDKQEQQVRKFLENLR